LHFKREFSGQSKNPSCRKASSQKEKQTDEKYKINVRCHNGVDVVDGVYCDTTASYTGIVWIRQWLWQRRGADIQWEVVWVNPLHFHELVSNIHHTGVCGAAGGYLLLLPILFSWV